MSNYRTHARFNFLFVLPVCSALLYFYAHPSSMCWLFLMGAFSYATLFMSPDLDLIHQVKLFSWRGLLTLPFRLYSKFFKHRGVSHHIFLGTLSRLIWAFVVYLLVVRWINWHYEWNVSCLRSIAGHQDLCFYGILGVFFADVGHLAKDRFPKKKRRKK